MEPLNCVVDLRDESCEIWTGTQAQTMDQRSAAAITGLTPDQVKIHTMYLGGGFGHFYAYAPEKFEYPINRFAMEVKRQLDVLDRHLATHTYMAGDEYSIADIAIYPWYGGLVEGKLYEAGEFLSVHEYSHVQRWAAAVAERPPVQRGRRINRVWGDEAGQVPERH
jgi:GST-like protein